MGLGMFLKSMIMRGFCGLRFCVSAGHKGAPIPHIPPIPPCFRANVGSMWDRGAIFGAFFRCWKPAP